MARRTRRGPRLGRAVLLLLLGLALGADCVASDRPLLASVDGALHLLPNLREDALPGGLRGAALSRALGEDDWALWPPVRHAPDAVRGAGGALEVLAPPSREHWLGTDDRGRDVLARLVHGARTTLALAALAALFALLAGGTLAVAAARFARLDRPVVLACDAVAAVPAVLFAVAAQGLVGAASLAGVAALIALPRAAELGRVVRASLRSALAAPYCEAARSAGASPGRVVLRHALPASVPAVRVAVALTAATAVLAEAALGFLGFGAPPPTASWGELLAQAHAHDLRWWLALPPGLVVVACAASLDALAQPRD